MERDEIFAEKMAMEAREDAIAREMEARRAARREAMDALVMGPESYEPNPYDGTYSEM